MAGCSRSRTLDIAVASRTALGFQVYWLPADSTAKITSDSLLGGVHVAIGAGGAAEDLKPGGEIENTQGAVDLFGLIGQAVRPAAAAPESE